MNRKTFFFIAAFLLIIVPAFAEAPVLGDFTAYTFWSFVDDYSRVLPDVAYGSMYLETFNFTPVGWSRDGKFAYVVDREPDLVGDIVYDFHIVDLVTDEYLLREQRFGYDIENEESGAVYLIDDYVEACGVYGIEYSPEGELVDYPFIYNDLAYSAAIEEVGYLPGSMAEYGQVATIESYRVRIRRSDGTSKIAYEVYPEESAGIFDVQVRSCFLSPFEDRVAIVLISILSGWENLYTTTVKLIGSHLAYGFESLSIGL